MDGEPGIKDRLVRLAYDQEFQTHIKIALGLIPGIGSVLSAVVDEYQSEWKERRVMGLIEELTQRLEGFESSVDQDYVRKEEFYFFFEEAARRYVSSTDRVHQDYLAGLIVRSALNGADKNAMEREYYLKKVVELSAIHLDLLRLYYDPARALQCRGIDPEEVKGYGLSEVVRRYLGGADMCVIRSAQKDLFSAGLSNSDGNIFGTVMAGRGVDVVAGRVTDTGRRFVEMCLPLA